jgi:purine nucleoside phosphorylase
VAAAAALAEATGVAAHDVAVMLGSGWRPAADLLGTPSHEIAMADLPGFVRPVVAGHGRTHGRARRNRGRARRNGAAGAGRRPPRPPPPDGGPSTSGSSATLPGT